MAETDELERSRAALQMINPAPYNAEAPPEALVGDITPTDFHYVRSNFEVPAHDGTLTIGAWSGAGKGFYAPVGADAAHSVFTAAPGSAPMMFPASMVWNTVKGGQTLPLKFNIFAGSVEKTGSDTFTNLTTAFQAAKMTNCTNVADTDPVDYTITATGSTTLRYDTTGMQWIYNWQTPKVNSTTCYRTWVTFADGSTLEAFFQLSK